jgi:hypothetical protein
MVWVGEVWASQSSFIAYLLLYYFFKALKKAIEANSESEEAKKCNYCNNKK